MGKYLLYEFEDGEIQEVEAVNFDGKVKVVICSMEGEVNLTKAELRKMINVIELKEEQL
jgi:hypothetical protein